MKPWYVTIQMKAIEQYFHVVLFIMKTKNIYKEMYGNADKSGQKSRFVHISIFSRF